MQPDLQGADATRRLKPPPLLALTPLRFLAAIYVILAHARLEASLSRFPAAARFFLSGYTGVTLFFVLSGFILTYNYSSVGDRRQFWAGRFARIYPVYLLSMVLVLLLFLPHPELWAAASFRVATVLSLLLLQSWWPSLSLSVNPPAWTLSVEAFFYASFPFLLPLFKRMKSRTFAVLQLAWLLAALLPLLALHQHRAELATRMVAFLEGPFPIVRLNAFLVGMYLGGRYLQGFHAGVERRRLAQWQLALGVGGSLALLCILPPQQLLPLRTLLLIYSYGLMIAGLASVQWRWLRNRWVQTAGEISYGMYILQFPVARMVYFCERRVSAALELNVWIFLLVLIPVCYLSFRWFEVPARIALRSMMSRSRGAPQA